MRRRPPSEDVILIVDDDEDLRALAQHVLAQFGFSVAAAADGREALVALERHHPSLILLDVIMPEADGFEVCRAVRERAGYENTPIVMMTARDDTASIDRAYEVGATDFMPKPINWKILGHRLRYILRASRAMEELARSRLSLAHAQRLAGLSSWEWDIEKNQMVWSKEIYHAFGVAEQDIEASVETFWRVIHPEDRAAVREAFIAALKREQPYNQDYRIVLPNGSVRTLHVQAETDYGPDGRARRMRGTMQDITERKRSEEQFRLLAFFDGLTTLPNRMLFK